MRSSSLMTSCTVDKLAQVARHRRLEGDQVDAAAADVALQLVDRAVAGDDLLGQRGIAAGERLHRLGNLVLDERAHLDDRFLDLAQLLVESFAWHVFPHSSRRLRAIR